VKTTTLAKVYFLLDSQLVVEERPYAQQQQHKGNIGKAGNVSDIHKSIPLTVRVNVQNEFYMSPLLNCDRSWFST